MEKEVYYLISDAAKQVAVESHVLRYWEEELHLPIKRNELGHRYYTREDVECFKEIKNLKEQGLQLKAIRMILKDGKIRRIHSEDEMPDEIPGQMIEVINERELTPEKSESKEEKGARLQILLQHMLAEVVRENNKDLCEEIKASVMKEMDYQFRLQEEREEARALERAKKEEEHYRKIDELLRSYNKKKTKDDEKQSMFAARKKHTVL